MARNARILIVDDEADFALAVAEYLGDLGYQVATAEAGWKFDSEEQKAPADLIILDINLPGESGFSILHRLRRRSSVPVIVLTSNLDTIDRILGLEAGADDYLQKPVELRELAARTAGLLERVNGRRRPLMLFEEVSVDLSAARILGQGRQAQRLSAGEVALLRAFSSAANRILTREELIEAAPGDSREAADRSVDARIARLRRKLGTECLRTIRGRGYMFVPPR